MLIYKKILIFIIIFYSNIFDLFEFEIIEIFESEDIEIKPFELSFVSIILIVRNVLILNI